ncbi:MAG TPA: outer membrane lipoprotein-sorting protein [Thermoanaerobaculia bacterium]|nr:outer membrane lipoprotein-sorting protein [Thermoanaerobaculia bacterium]
MRKLLLALLLTTSLRAEDATSLLARSDEFRNPLGSFAIDVELTSYEGSKTDTSKFRVYGKGSDRSVVEFTAPATEKGKFLLMLRDAMWIYMPSTSRPIRISPLQRLMGQASNGDVARTSFTTDYVAKSASEDGKAWLLELEAKDPSLSYKRVQLWIDRSSYEPVRADFYVASGKLLKRAHYRKFSMMAGRRVLTEVEIEDLVRPGRRTVMHYANLAERENPDKMFTKDSLGKW